MAKDHTPDTEPAQFKQDKETMMQSHQERVITELNELCEKHIKLGLFLDGAVFKSLDTSEQSRLKRQYIVMGEYADILRERIANFPNDTR